VLATAGTHGDLNPFIGVARELQRFGFAPLIVTHAEYRSLVETAGIAFLPMRPDRRQLGMDSSQNRMRIMRAARRRPQLVLTRYVLPYLQESFEDALTALAGARLMFSSSLSFGARLAAEKLGVPNIAVVLQPGMMWSAHDPPTFGNHAGVGGLLHAGGPTFNRAMLGVARWLSRRWTRPVDRLRAQLGLPGQPHPLFEAQWAGAAVLGLYSAVLGGLQPDHPPRFSVAGFSFHDGDGDLPPDIEDFLRHGSSPLVFTLGTSAVHDSARFVTVALQAVTVLRMRAIIILDEVQRALWQTGLPDHVRVTGYLPYSRILPRAQVIIHHGGIGTTGQALRSGRPQLIAPYFVDQPDNASRVERCGVGHVLPLDRWTPRRLVAALQRIMDDDTLRARAERLASDMANEDGATAAAKLAVKLLRSPSQVTLLPLPTDTRAP
jgi:rhamnosyltransferase subunit B